MDERRGSFGDVLRQLRSTASLSQEELAERSGLSRRGISDLERGVRRAPWPETVRMLADALELAEGDRAALLAAARPSVFHDAASSRSDPTPATVPTPLTRLIGREHEVTALRATLHRDDARLVTVTGPGGVGKTRLAIAVADGMRDDFPDGIAFVDLSPLTEPEAVVPTIAAALRVRDVARQPLLVTVADFLAAKRILLILDNCERVLAAAPDITALLASVPGLTLFATSREALHVRGEYEFPLLPLPLADPDHRSPIEELAIVPAVTLFLERATASQPDFVLTDENAQAVSAICRRLDGLPLAIELVAVRIKVLPPAALLARLERRLPVLTGGGRDLPARQRTLRDTLAWSYALLALPERRLFRHLAVFASGFTLAAAEAVTHPDEHADVLDGVTALVQQSLLRQMPGSAEEPRFGFLETIREFGLEQLATAGEEDEARDRHACYFLQLATRLAPGLQIIESLEQRTHLAAEHDNLRLALAWLDRRNEQEALLQLAAMLSGTWLASGRFREGLEWMERAARRLSDTPSTARVRVLYAAGVLALNQGAYDRAEPFLTESLTVAHALGDPFLVGEALAFAAYLTYRRGEYGRADEQFAEARRLLHGVTDAVRATPAHLGSGDNALVQGHFTRARMHYQHAIDINQAEGYDWLLCDAQAGLAGVYYCLGDVPRAIALYAESFARAEVQGLTHQLVSVLLGLAGVAASTERAEAGARLLGAAEGIAATTGGAMFPRDVPIRVRALATLRSALGEERLARLQETGRALTVKQAMAEAREVAEATMKPAPMACS